MYISRNLPNIAQVKSNIRIKVEKLIKYHSIIPFTLDIGIFSGSFNPIHIGHLALANYLCEYEGLDEVWFLVTPRNPLKDEKELMDDRLRLHLTQLAVEEYPRFRASDFEFHLPRPSYTVHTLDKLRKVYPGHTFHLIIGSDNWRLFPRWYEADRLLAENRLLVYPRPGYPTDTRHLPSHVRVAEAPLLEVSSTFIRQALKEGKDIRYFLHPKVWEKIQKPRNLPTKELKNL